MKLKKILIPLDGSHLAERALAKAVDLAQSAGDPTLQLLRAAEATAWPGADMTGEQVRVVREAAPILLVRDDGAPVDAPVGAVEERTLAGGRR